MCCLLYLHMSSMSSRIACTFEQMLNILQISSSNKNHLTLTTSYNPSLEHWLQQKQSFQTQLITTRVSEAITPCLRFYRHCVCVQTLKFVLFAVISWNHFLSCLTVDENNNQTDANNNNSSGANNTAQTSSQDDELISMFLLTVWLSSPSVSLCRVRVLAVCVYVIAPIILYLRV